MLFSGSAPLISPRVEEPSVTTGPFQVKRRFVNYLLQPFLQLRIGLVHVVLTVVFVTGIGWFAWAKLREFTNIIASLTETEAEVKGMLDEYLASVATTGLALGLMFIVLSLAASIFLTHKLVGPTIAFRRHIRSIADGKFNARTYLRKGDAFLEVADELNRLSEVMEKKSRGQA